MSRLFRQAFLDISRGYSTFAYDSKEIFIRHLSFKEHLAIETLEQKYREEAKSNGILNEAEQLEFLKKEGLWSDIMEGEIAKQTDFLKGLYESKKLIKLPSHLDRHINDINKEEKKLGEMNGRRRELIGLTCEGWATKKINDYYILNSLFIDNDFKQPLFTELEFDEIDETTFIKVLILYNHASEPCSDTNIKKLAMQDFYQAYYYLCEDDFYAFLGKPIIDFTYFQIKLCNYSKHYKSMMQEVDIKTLSFDARQDPDRFENYVSTYKNGKNLVDNNPSGNVAIVGGTKADIKSLTNESTNAAQLPNKPMNMQELSQLWNK